MKTFPLGLTLCLSLLAGCGSAHRVGAVTDLDCISVHPGDRFLLQSGKTYAGPLLLGPAQSGGDWRPVTIESDGPEPAIIDGGTGSAIVMHGVSNIRLHNVRVVGAGRKEGSRQGVGVLIEKSSHITIDRVEAAGFQRSGVEIRGSHRVRLTEVYAHDNGYAGIASNGDRSHDLYLTRCRGINNPGDPTNLLNHSGNGIVLMSVSGAVIDRCEAARNGWDMPHKGNGPVGIWCAFADHVTIRHCVSHHNTSADRDGGGFDFDGGTTHSVMEHNYSHHNKGFGYLLYEFGSGMGYGDNTVRDCVSEEDGEGGIGIGVSPYAAPGTPLGRCDIHHNTIRNSLGRPAVQVAEGNPGLRVAVHDNTFLTTASPPEDGGISLRHNTHASPGP